MSNNEQDKKELIPKLRFPEFIDIKEWEKLTLKDISERIEEKVNERKLTTVSISAGTGFVSQEKKFSRDISGSQYKNYIIIHNGDFSYNKGNSKRFPQGCIYKLKEFKQAAAPNAFISFRFKPNFEGDFYQGYFDNNYHGQQLVKFITSGARMDGLLNIKANDFFSIVLPTPTKPEQQKIASCLSSLDELITAQTEKLEALQAHKKGLMQNLFPQEGQSVPNYRFPEFEEDGEWVEEVLENIATFSKGKGISKANIVDNGKLPCIRYGELYTHYNEIISDVISYTNLEYKELVLSEENDVIIPSSGETQIDIATAACVLKSGIALGGDLNIIKSELNGVFLSYYLNYVKKNEIAQMAQGISVVHLYSNQLKTLKINVPKKDEQQKIASCLSELDRLITTQKGKIEQLQQHKKGLMQGLFPKMKD